MRMKLRIKDVYGVRRIYPLDFVQEIEALTGQKTLSNKQIKALKALGVEFEIEAPALESIH